VTKATAQTLKPLRHTIERLVTFQCPRFEQFHSLRIVIVGCAEQCWIARIASAGNTPFVELFQLLLQASPFECAIVCLAGLEGTIHPVEQ
jgi:hypothetical protein